MPFFTPLILRHSIEIHAGPEKIWDFFQNLDKNYRLWHPQDHIVFKWTKGRPLEKGSRCYAEQYVMGKVTKYKTLCAEIAQYRKIVLQFSMPIALISPRVEWLLEPLNSKTVFTALTYVRAGYLLQKIFKKDMNRLITLLNRHVEEEAENLKSIIEQKKIR